MPFLKKEGQNRIDSDHIVIHNEGKSSRGSSVLRDAGRRSRQVKILSPVRDAVYADAIEQNSRRTYHLLNAKTAVTLKLTKSGAGGSTSIRGLRVGELMQCVPNFDWRICSDWRLRLPRFPRRTDWLWLSGRLERTDGKGTSCHPIIAAGRADTRTELLLPCNRRWRNYKRVTNELLGENWVQLAAASFWCAAVWCGRKSVEWKPLARCSSGTGGSFKSPYAGEAFTILKNLEEISQLGKEKQTGMPLVHALDLLAIDVL